MNGRRSRPNRGVGGYRDGAGPRERGVEALIEVRAESAKATERRLADDRWTRNGMLRTAGVAGWAVRIGKVG